MLRRPPRSTRPDTLFPTRRSSDLAQRLQDRVRGMRYALGKGAENARLRFDKVYLQPASRSRSAMLFQHIGQPHQFGGGSEEHTSELQSLMRTSYAVFCLKKKKQLNKRIWYTQYMT